GLQFLTLLLVRKRITAAVFQSSQSPGFNCFLLLLNQHASFHSPPSCRSKAVNKHISHCRLCFGPSSQAVHGLLQLLAFPVHEELRSLTLSGSDPDGLHTVAHKACFVSEMGHLFEAMDTAPEPEGFLSRLRTVDHLEITGCSINSTAAEKLCRLFPRLCMLGGPDDRPGILRLEQCKLAEGAYGLLFSCMRLECLAIVECTLSAPPPHTPLLASLLSSISSMGDTLRTLILCYHHEETVEKESNVSELNSELKEHSGGTLFQPLEQLRHITGLHLGKAASMAAARDPGAVRGLLSKLPLQSLTLSYLGACSVVPPSVEHVCFDLRLIVAPSGAYKHGSDLNEVVNTLKDLRRQKCVTLGQFMFDHQGSPKGQLPMIRSLWSLPFEIKCAESFFLWSHEFWDIPGFVGVLQALLPMKPSFASVKALKAFNVCIEPSALRALATLFGSCERLVLRFEAEPMDWDAIEHDEDISPFHSSHERGGLQELLHGMPNLSYLNCLLDVDLKDVYIQALLAACDAGRAFKLVLDCPRRYTDDRCQEVEALEQGWQQLQAARPRRQSQKVMLRIEQSE
ncbi:hypothetical protein DUNSADRAFT_9343, partial [Dunaliella salina]